MYLLYILELKGTLNFNVIMKLKIKDMWNQFHYETSFYVTSYNVQNSKYRIIYIFCDNNSCHHDVIVKTLDYV